MTINLPENLERSIMAEVDGGHFASVDDAIAEAVQLLLQKVRGDSERSDASTTGPSAPASRPIWEVFGEITASIPDEEWARLPTDGAEQHDHYIHGTPKRPKA